LASAAADCFCNARSAAACRLVDFMAELLIRELCGEYDSLSVARNCARALRATSILAKAATNITTLAANPAGTHGVSSSCNIHHSRKKSAAAMAVAATM